MQQISSADQRFFSDSQQNISAISRSMLSEISLFAFIQKTKKGDPEFTESPFGTRKSISAIGRHRKNASPSLSI